MVQGSELKLNHGRLATSEKLLAPKVYILERFADRNPVYSTWLDDCPWPVEIVRQLPHQWTAPADAGIIVTHQHYQWETISSLRRHLETPPWLPQLILSDGVLEFRNSWQNPTVAEGALFQPLVGHKLACIGRAPARTIESWGNTGKCEIVGHPRFDHWWDAPHTPVQNEGPLRLLVTTARTPWFTEQQRRDVIDGLNSLVARFERNMWAGNRPIEVTWRLSEHLADEVAANNSPDGTLTDAIEMSDAVITTPSTVYLESVIKRRPTALLDFTNSPDYLPPAWRISAPSHINSVLAELADPPAAKMLFQRQTLLDQVELGGNATARLMALIGDMIKAGQQAKIDKQRLCLPDRILSDPQRGIAQIGTEFDAQSLYPDSEAFQNYDVDLLRLELAHAVARLGQLPVELQSKNDHIEDMAECVEQGLAREKVLGESIARQQEDLEKKTSHIDYLNELLEAMSDERKEIREQLRAARVRLNRLENLVAQQRVRLSDTVKQLSVELDVVLNQDQPDSDNEVGPIGIHVA